MRFETVNTPQGVLLTRELTGLDEVIGCAKRIMSSRPNDDCASIRGYSHFTQTESLEEATELCEYGWPEGVAKARDLMEELNLDDSANQGIQIMSDFDVSGDEPDVERYLSGEPENMVQYRTDESMMGRTVKLLMNIGQHASVGSEVIMRRGVVVAAALGNISAAGYGVDLVMIEHVAPSYGGYSSQKLQYNIPLVTAGNYFNLDSLIFSLVHPSMLRRMIFAVNECESQEIRRQFGFHEDGGYGMPLEIPAQDAANAVVIDKHHYLLGSDDQMPASVSLLTKEILQVAQSKQGL